MIRYQTRVDRWKIWRGEADLSFIEFLTALAEARTAPLSEDQSCALDCARQISRVLAALSFNERSVFILRFCDGLGLSEIFEAVELSVASTKTSLVQSIKAVRLGLSEQHSQR